MPVVAALILESNWGWKLQLAAGRVSQLAIQATVDPAVGAPYPWVQPMVNHSSCQQQQSICLGGHHQLESCQQSRQTTP